MKQIKDRSALLYILLPLWLAASYGALKAEWVSVNFLSLVMFDASTKQTMTQKPIDALALKAEEMALPGSRVFFFDPYPWDSPAGGFYAGKLRYQLYQRELKVVSPGEDFDYRSMGPGDFALFIWPEGEVQPVERELAALAGMEEVWRHADSRSTQSVYRVPGERR